MHFNVRHEAGKITLKIHARNCASHPRLKPAGEDGLSKRRSLIFFMFFFFYSRSQDAIERSLEYSCPSDRNHLLSCMALYAALSPFLSVNATPSSTPHVVARWRSGHIVLHDRDTRLCAESRILVRNCPQAFLYTSAQRVFVLQFDQTKKGLEFLRKKKSAHQRIAPTARVDRWRA